MAVSFLLASALSLEKINPPRKWLVDMNAPEFDCPVRVPLHITQRMAQRALG